MTDEQLQQLVAVGDAIRETPRPWIGLTEHEQSTLMGLLMPEPSFEATQRHYLSRWFLAASPSDCEAAEALWPPGHHYPPRELNGQLYLSADLLSDALGGGRLAAMLPILETLVLTYIEPEEWPEHESDP